MTGGLRNLIMINDARRRAPHCAAPILPSWPVFLSVALLLAVLAASCDFPQDPPLRIDDPGMNRIVQDIDSARSVIPLQAGNKWMYIAVPVQFNPQAAMFATATELTWNTQVYYDLRYGFYLKSPVSTTFAFPILLKKTSVGLSFYERSGPIDTLLIRQPRLAFSLPYPARTGTTWSDPSTDYTVQVVAKDTLIRAYNSNEMFRCYRYSVERHRKHLCDIYVIPGSAFLRVEYDDISFHTTGWWLR